jgi:hypothetical protein
MVTNDDGEPLGTETLYDDEFDPDYFYDSDFGEQDYDDFDDSE